MALTLAEAKAERDAFKRAIPAHKANCSRCGSTARGRARPAPCADGAALAELHRQAVERVKGWFAPGPDQGALI